LATKWKRFSHAAVTKALFFLLAVACLTWAMKIFVDVGLLVDGNFAMVLEEDYLTSRSFIEEIEPVIRDLVNLVGKYKNEEHILQGGLVSLGRLQEETRYAWRTAETYDPAARDEENFNKYREQYPEEIAAAADRLVKEDLKAYHALQQRLARYDGVIYYATEGDQVFTNTRTSGRPSFKSYPVYLVAENYRYEFYPKALRDNRHLYRVTSQLDRLDLLENSFQVGFTAGFLQDRIQDWEATKARATEGLQVVALLLVGFLLSLAYLVWTAGRKSQEDREIHFLPWDRLYNDLNVVFSIIAASLGTGLLDWLFDCIGQVIQYVVAPTVAVLLVLFLSLVKHYKNGTLLKHTLVYRAGALLYTAVSQVYAGGSVAVKIMVAVIGYPILVVLSLYLAPVTIGVVAWLAFQQVKAYNAIKEGVEKIKNGDIHHIIPVSGNGELAQLAAGINSIAGGLKAAVENELKSERLKTELITNVSHDLRTPLTSIITYVDLLQKEQDPQKQQEYVRVLDQKAKRLKTLVDDLFEAAKASSGSIPVQFEKIDLVSLVSQGLGEVSDRIEAANLDFRFRHPEEKVYAAADGRLLWRAVENLLSNIFKYALPGSRVYIDLEDLGREVRLTFKNISARELNISAEELLERFTRGDEARTTEGSGLGLSIAKSLVELQKGRFALEIDGDLFKAIITMPKYAA